jgi:hypothetical protein
MSSCVRRLVYLSRHKRLDVFHVMIRIFCVYLFHCNLHLYAISQPLPNCVSSSITARVCVCVCVSFQSNTPLCLQCTYTAPCFSFFVCVCVCFRPSVYCAAHVPHSSAILFWTHLRGNKDTKQYRQLVFK